MSQENARFIEITGTPEEIARIKNIALDTQKVLKEEFKIKITNEEAIPTIVCKFLDVMIHTLDTIKSKTEDESINLMNRIELGVTYRESDDGEKDGNFAPFCFPGPYFKTGIKSDEMSESDED